MKLIRYTRKCMDISIHEMNMMINNNSNIILIDVRSKQEFQEGHLRDAINIPLYNIQKTVEERIKDKDKTIITYCSAGIRSKKAATIIQNLGYKNVFNLKEGAI